MPEPVHKFPCVFSTIAPSSVFQRSPIFPSSFSTHLFSHSLFARFCHWLSCPLDVCFSSLFTSQSSFFSLSCLSTISNLRMFFHQLFLWTQIINVLSGRIPAAGRLTDLWCEFWQQIGTEGDDEKRAPIKLRFNRDDKPIDDGKRKVESKLECLSNFRTSSLKILTNSFQTMRNVFLNSSTLNTAWRFVSKRVH